MMQRFGPAPAVNHAPPRSSTRWWLAKAGQAPRTSRVNFEKRWLRIGGSRRSADRGAFCRWLPSAEGDFLIGADGGAFRPSATTHVVPDAPKPFDLDLIFLSRFLCPRESLLEIRGHTAKTLIMTRGPKRLLFFGYGLLQFRSEHGARCCWSNPAHARHRRGPPFPCQWIRSAATAIFRPLSTPAGTSRPPANSSTPLQEIGRVGKSLDLATRCRNWSRGAALLVDRRTPRMQTSSALPGQGASIALWKDALRLLRALLRRGTGNQQRL